jgi:streptogramin lyase
VRGHHANGHLGEPQPGSDPTEIAPGPDGNLWFIDGGATKAIGRITPTRTITEFSARPQAAGARRGCWGGAADQGDERSRAVTETAR